MSEARERIWATVNVNAADSWAAPFEFTGSTPYVRADLYEVLANQRDGWKDDAQRYATNAEFWKGKHESERAINADLVEAAEMAVAVVKDWIKGKPAEDEDTERFCAAFAAATLANLRAALAKAEAREKGEG